MSKLLELTRSKDWRPEVIIFIHDSILYLNYLKINMGFIATDYISLHLWIFHFTPPILPGNNRCSSWSLGGGGGG